MISRSFQTARTLVSHPIAHVHHAVPTSPWLPALSPEGRRNSHPSGWLALVPFSSDQGGWLWEGDKTGEDRGV